MILRTSTFKIASRAGAALSTQSSSAILFGSQQPQLQFSRFNKKQNKNIKCASFSTAPIDNSNNEKPVLFDVVPKEDFGQYKEYSVIFTNRALNLMSDPFQKVMRDLNMLLKHTYNASKVAIIPG